MKRKYAQTSDDEKKAALDRELSQDTDYRQAPAFSDLVIECSDGASLHYFKAMLVRVEYLKTRIIEKTAKTPLQSPVNRCTIQFAAPVVNSFLNWIDMARVPSMRSLWLQSKDLAQLLDLGRLGNLCKADELISGCVAAIRLTFDIPRVQIEDLARFAVEIGEPFRTFFENSRPFALPSVRRIPEWPPAVWTAFLEAEDITAEDRLAKIFVTIHAGIGPSDKLRQAVENDLDYAHQFQQSRRMLDYWTLLDTRDKSLNSIKTGWITIFMWYFMFGLPKYWNAELKRVIGTGPPKQAADAPAVGVPNPATNGPVPVPGIPAASGPGPVTCPQASGPEQAARGPEPPTERSEPAVGKSAGESELVAGEAGQASDSSGSVAGPPAPTVPEQKLEPAAVLLELASGRKPARGPPKSSPPKSGLPKSVVDPRSAARRGRRPTNRTRRVAKTNPE
jgi:hypothetical protein